MNGTEAKALAKSGKNVRRSIWPPGSCLVYTEDHGIMYVYFVDGKPIRSHYQVTVNDEKADDWEVANRADPVGYWHVETEGDDEEGRTRKDLGTHFGHLAEVLRKLSGQARYTLKVRRGSPVPRRTREVLVELEGEPVSLKTLLGTSALVDVDHCGNWRVSFLEV